MRYAKGDLIGGTYEVRGVLGAGGFGVVYLVHSAAWDRPFAFKTFRDEFLGDPAVRDQFRKEADLWIRIGEHPCVVRAYFVEELDGRLFIASEFIEGDRPGLNSASLDEFLKAGPLGLRDALLWSLDLCWGMEFAYSRGIRCHRDIKPSNVLIDKRRIAKVSDFGLAGAVLAKGGISQVGYDLGDKGVGESSQTNRSLGVGMPTHMAPEHFVNASTCDERSDIYSFGVMLFQMVEGRLPFLAKPPKDSSGEEEMRFTLEMFRLHCDAPIPTSESPLSTVITRSLQKRPDARYQSFKELLSGLVVVLNQRFSDTDLPRKVQALTEAYDEAITQAASRDLSVNEWNNKGASLLPLGHPEEAIQCFSRAIELDSFAAPAWSNKGAALEHLGRHIEALECYERAVRLEPSNPKNWNNIGVCLFLIGRYQEALRCCERAVQLDPASGQAWFNKGKFLGKIGRVSEAVECFERALSLIPGEPKVWKNMGCALAALDRLDEALDFFTHSLKMDAHDAEAWHEKGCALVRLDRCREALPCLQRAINIDPGIVSSWFQKGLVEFALGYREPASDSFRKFLSLAGEGYEEERVHAAKSLDFLKNL